MVTQKLHRVDSVRDQVKYVIKNKYDVFRHSSRPEYLVIETSDAFDFDAIESNTNADITGVSPSGSLTSDGTIKFELHFDGPSETTLEDFIDTYTFGPEDNLPFATGDMVHTELTEKRRVITEIDLEEKKLFLEEDGWFTFEEVLTSMANGNTEIYKKRL